MYEDSWYSFVPDFQRRAAASGAQGPGHRRKESLLQQPNVCAPPVEARRLSCSAALTLDVGHRASQNIPPKPTRSRRF